MNDTEHRAPGLFDTGRRLLDNALGAIYNRLELLIVELGEEKANLVELLIYVIATLFFAVMTVIVLTATVILLFPEDKRVYAGAGFCVLYLIGAIWSFTKLKARLNQGRTPFAESINELKKDREWLQPK